MKSIDITNKRFGSLVAIRFVEKRGSSRIWLCKCDCGAEKTFFKSNLLNGKSRSCGCMIKERIGEANSTHGLSDTPEYHTWCALRKRCQNPNDPAYHHYGGRGISVHPSWADFTTFLNDMGQRPSPKHTLERLDNDGDYAPGNCKWETRKAQANNRRSSRLIAFNGETRTLSEWADFTGIKPRTIYQRLYNGWPIDQALTVPAISSGKNNAPII